VIRFDLGLDLFPLLSVVLAAVTCAVLGNFLVLRRLCLMGDAISHSVLPGLVIAFLLAATRNPLVMLLGAALSGIATVVLVEVVKKLGRVESGAAMGVVFSVLFALGVLLIEKAAARHVDLDADCVLHGQLETLVWYGAPREWGGLSVSAIFEAAPRQMFMLAGACAAAVVFVALLFKELRLAAFDAELATAQGFSAPALHGALMIVVAVATVASFEAVGSILVIAMLVCPAASARLLTDRLRPQIIVSVIIAVAAARSRARWRWRMFSPPSTARTSQANPRSRATRC
jgi:manganese/zinc/iron transport system permease protein